jgi:hypothetical protein
LYEIDEGIEGKLKEDLVSQYSNATPDLMQFQLLLPD